VGRCWWATILLGVLSISVESGGELHSIRVGMLAVAPWLVIGLHRMAQATRSDTARPAMQRTVVVAVVLLPVIVLLDWYSSDTLGGGSSVVVVGLLAFSSAMRRWAVRRVPELVPIWRRTRLLALVASLGVVAAWSAWVARGVVDGRWSSVSVSRDEPLQVAAIGLAGLLCVSALLTVAWATRTTHRHLDEIGRTRAL
jgi:hypothetical protein